jgi:hypothetical protein
MQKKSEASEALLEVIHDVGIPARLHTDFAKEEMEGTWKKQTVTEPYSPWQNRAENMIDDLKRGILYATRRRGSPKRLWNYCGVWVSKIRNVIAHPAPALNGRVPDELMTGDTPEIAELLQFDWYQLVWYHSPGGFPEQKRQLGRWIGVATNVGQALTYWILTEKCQVIARSSVHPVKPDEAQTTEFIADRLWLDAQIKEKIGDQVKEQDIGEILPGEDTYNLFDDVEDGVDDEVRDERFDRPEADEFTPYSLVNYLTAKVLLPRGEESFKGTVVGRKKGADGNPIGLANSNPILDTREYEVEFPDGTFDSYTANIIAGKPLRFR